jgi:putative phosphoesterase
MRIGVISDTHIAAGRDGQAGRRVVPPAVFRAFLDVDLILHAGDIAHQGVLDDLAALAPVHAVQGNVDPLELARSLPERLALDLDGARVGLTHGHLGRGRSTPERARGQFVGDDGLAAVVFGHSHEPCNHFEDGALLFNPGSPTERRRQPRPSYGLLTIENGAVRGEIVYL